MSVLKTALSVLLASIALAAVLGNARTVFRYINSKRTGSLVPLIGGLSGAGAMLMGPYPHLYRWAWIPLAFDPGSLPMIAVAMVFWLRKVTSSGS
jgi:hypothetical protein